MSDTNNIKEINDHIVYFFDTLESTNDQITNYISNDRNIACVAKNQTNGRGRNSASWESDEGNLFCSLLYTLDKNHQELAQLSLLAAVAVGRVVKKIIPNEEVKYKWPNDIYVNDAKISGILIENILSGNSCKSIIGIGINVNSSPGLAERKTCSLKYFIDSIITSEEVLENLLVEFRILMDVWRNSGFSSIREEWLDNAWKLGEKITIKQSEDEKISGIFKNIDRNGGTNTG